MINVDHIFSYHSPTPEKIPVYNELREGARAFAELIVRLVPEGADQEAAIRKVREAVMTANAAVALDGRLWVGDNDSPGEEDTAEDRDVVLLAGALLDVVRSGSAWTFLLGRTTIRLRFDGRLVRPRFMVTVGERERGALFLCDNINILDARLQTALGIIEWVEKITKESV
ncbi:MAG: hypothetical protein KKH12_15900 [Gammaproteobacteria bacterium]|nr:hypothetical protein [Gammaproteobacteria bacterium]